MNKRKYNNLSLYRKVLFKKITKEKQKIINRIKSLFTNIKE